MKGSTNIRDKVLKKPALIAGEYICSGVGSTQGKGKHCVFLDLDGHSVQDSVRIAKFLIGRYCLSNCYIQRSSPGNHHLVCFDVLPFKVVQEIARKYGHGQWAKYRGKEKDFVLRTMPKFKVEKSEDGEMLNVVPDTEPCLECIVCSPYEESTLKSKALMNYMGRVWGVDIPAFNVDDSTGVRIHVYRVRLVKHG